VSSRDPDAAPADDTAPPEDASQIVDEELGGLVLSVPEMSDEAMLAMFSDAMSAVDDVESDEDVSALIDAMEADSAAPPMLDPELAALLDEAEAEAQAPPKPKTAPPPPEPVAVPAQPIPDRFPPLPEEASLRERMQPTPIPIPTQTTPPPRRTRFAWLYNLLTILIILGGCGLLFAFITVWQNPYSALNPFPPLTPIPLVISQTPTPSLTPVPTDTPTPTPTRTPTLTPTITLSPTETPVPGTPTPFYGFTIPPTLGSTTVYISNPEQRGGCQWSSIAGTVADVNGNALNGYQIRILGGGVDETLISGTATGYGPGGFELPLGYDARDGQYAVQLLDPGGTPVSDVYTITTSSRCDWNISVVRFTEQPAPG
jgi:type VI secretion system secreted protein VgrG